MAMKQGGEGGHVCESSIEVITRLQADRSMRLLQQLELANESVVLGMKALNDCPL